MTDQPQLPEAELAALADGSLPADRRAQLHARIESSPELAAALAEQERAVTMLRALDEPAPAPLRERVRAMTDPDAASARTPSPRWRRSLFVPAATALAVVVAGLVILLGGGGAPPTVPETAHLALASATSPAPAQNPTSAGVLRLSVGGIAFPYYEDTAGWAATGTRADTLDGRRVVTVFYAGHGHRVGYAIVSGAPLAVGGGTLVSRGGERYWLQHAHGAELITWRQAGHTCVIAGRAVSRGTLVQLASAEEAQAARSAS